MKKLYIILVFISLNIYGQTDSIRIPKFYEIAFRIDSVKGKSRKFKMKMDSIEIKGQRYAKKIETINHFQKSKSNLEIDYYFEENNLILVMVKEPAPNGMKELYLHSIFYIENDKITSEEQRNTVLPCMAIPLDKNIYELYGYNKSINGEFLRKYIFDLVKKITNHR
jgi:hypothetical protein